MATTKPLKAGDKITWTRRNGEVARGKVVRIENNGKGDWLTAVMLGENGKTNGMIAKMRPSQATRV